MRISQLEQLQINYVGNQIAKFDACETRLAKLTALWRIADNIDLFGRDRDPSGRLTDIQEQIVLGFVQTFRDSPQGIDAIAKYAQPRAAKICERVK